jgi:hypothetical protein
MSRSAQLLVVHFFAFVLIVHVPPSRNYATVMLLSR